MSARGDPMNAKELIEKVAGGEDPKSVIEAMDMKKYRKQQVEALRMIFQSNPKGNLKSIFPKAAREGIGSKTMSELVLSFIVRKGLKLDMESGKYEWLR